MHNEWLICTSIPCTFIDNDEGRFGLEVMQPCRSYRQSAHGLENDDLSVTLLNAKQNECLVHALICVTMMLDGTLHMYCVDGCERKP